jgi:N-acetylglucosaminyldiphosphoundecaprenol N-acetyl-beta-D-mannosaminyltransferase
VSSTVVCEIDDFDLAAFATIAASFGSQRYGYVVTPNVDHLLRYYEDPSFRALYRSAAYILLDSRVIALAMRLVRGRRLAVCTGSDLTVELLARVASPTDRIVLIGTSAPQADKIGSTFGLTNVRHHNPPMGFIRDPDATDACLRFIEAQSPFRFCFLAVGSPQQEVLAQRLQARGTTRGLVLCVGAALNFITGTERRAPRWMQRIALEWLFRLLQDPRRLARRYLVRGPRVFVHLLHGDLVPRLRLAHVCRYDDEPSAGT